MFEEIASQGRLSCSDCVRRVSSIVNVEEDAAVTMFSRLCGAHLIIRCIPKKEDEEGEDAGKASTPMRVTHVEDPYAMPERMLDADKTEPNSKKETPLST